MEEGQASDAVNSTVIKEILLSDGRKAVINAFKGKHVFEAMKESGTDSNKYLQVLISKVVTIDGKNIVEEDMDEMPGPDALKIIGEFSSNFQ